MALVVVLFCNCLTHFWFNDSKKVPSNDQLLGKAVMLIRLEGNAKETHNAGVAGQVQGDAVLSQKALQLS